VCVFVFAIVYLNNSGVEQLAVRTIQQQAAGLQSEWQYNRIFVLFLEHRFCGAWLPQKHNIVIIPQ
jgi:hypothetical protein